MHRHRASCKVTMPNPDENVYDDIHELNENSEFLKAIEERDVCLDIQQQLPEYEEQQYLEQSLIQQGSITFDKIFHEPCGYYNIKNFLIADYAVDRAIFIKDVEAYRAMRFESARQKVARQLYQRFVAQDDRDKIYFPKNISVFQLMNKQNKYYANGSNNEEKTDTTSTASSTISSNINNISFYATKNKTNEIDETAQYYQNLGYTSEQQKHSTVLIGICDNPIGVYGKSIQTVKERVLRGEAPRDQFDEVAHEVMSDLRLDVFPRFCRSTFYQRYIRCKFIETVKISIRDFTTFRVLGRGGFGAVHACRKNNSGSIYAMKSVNKKLVKMKNALDNIMEERNVLTMMQSNFLTNLKYAQQDEDNLYLIMDLMLGGDLKFHLINAGKFTEKRTRFYAAQVLLGLEHVHSKSVIYRDIKLENVQLDHYGNCKLSDLGLAVVTTVKIKGYAGTPGYTSPEMIKNRYYGPATDIFSYGVMVYRMLCGSKPFKGKTEGDLDKAVIEKKPFFPVDVFSSDAINLLTHLLQKKPENRLGCGEKGIEEIKEHRFFHTIDWGQLEAGYIDPPFVPNKFDVNAASLKDIGDFDKAKYKQVKLDDRFRARVAHFGYVSRNALQEELVTVMEKADEGINFEKFSIAPKKVTTTLDVPNNSCCTIM